MATLTVSCADSITAPVIVHFPKETHVTEGDTVHLAVRVSGSPQPTLAWHCNGRPVQTAGSRLQLAEDGSLIILSSEPNQTGVYCLKAHNSEGRAEREVKVFVHVSNPHSLAKCGSVSARPVPVEGFEQHIRKLCGDHMSGFREEFMVGTRIVWTGVWYILMYILNEG